MEKYYFRPHNVKTFTGKTWHGHANQPNIVPYVHKQQHSVFFVTLHSDSLKKVASILFKIPESASLCW